jgi:hypothetical protein
MSDHDLIRRGDVLRVVYDALTYSSGQAAFVQRRIRALPAVQPDETRAAKLYHIWQSTLNDSDYTDEARRKSKAMLVHELISGLETRLAARADYEALTAERDAQHEAWKQAMCEFDKKCKEANKHYARAEAAAADNARLREGIQSLEGPLWRLILRDENCIDAPCDDQNCQCRSKFDRIYKQARAALTGNVTVGGGRVDWGDQPVAAPTGKADT